MGRANKHCFEPLQFLQQLGEAPATIKKFITVSLQIVN